MMLPGFLRALLCPTVLTALVMAEAPSGWFEFNPRNTPEPGVIGLADWLGAPAGRQGFLTERVRLDPYREGTVIRSTTGELVRDLSAAGHFTLSTRGTRAVVGRASGVEHAPGDIVLTIENPFAVVILTDLTRNGDLDCTPNALLTLIARERNTRMRYSADGTTLLEVGHGPILLEGVRAALAAPRRSYGSRAGPRRPSHRPPGGSRGRRLADRYRTRSNTLLRAGLDRPLSIQRPASILYCSL